MSQFLHVSRVPRGARTTRGLAIDILMCNFIVEQQHWVIEPKLFAVAPASIFSLFLFRGVGIVIIHWIQSNVREPNPRFKMQMRLSDEKLITRISPISDLLTAINR